MAQSPEQLRSCSCLSRAVPRLGRAGGRCVVWSPLCCQRRAIHGCTILSDSLSDWCWLLDLMATTVGRLSDILVSLIWPCLIHPQLFPLSISSSSVSVLGLGWAGLGVSSEPPRSCTTEPLQSFPWGWGLYRVFWLHRELQAVLWVRGEDLHGLLWQIQFQYLKDPIPISEGPRARVGMRELKTQKPYSCSWWFFKGEQYLLNLFFFFFFFVLNMAFGNNVTKNLFWYNSRPHSCVWNFTFSACKPSVLYFARDHLRVPLPLRHWISDSPWLLSPLLMAAFRSPNLPPEGDRYLFTSHSCGGVFSPSLGGDGIDAVLGSLVGIRTLQQQLKEKKNPLFLAPEPINCTLRGLLKVLPLACWKTSRKTESFLPLLVQYVYIYRVWNIYIYTYTSIVLQLVFPSVHSNELWCYFEAF